MWLCWLFILLASKLFAENRLAVLLQDQRVHHEELQTFQTFFPQTNKNKINYTLTENIILLPHKSKSNYQWCLSCNLTGILIAGSLFKFQREWKTKRSVSPSFNLIHLDTCFYCASIWGGLIDWSELNLLAQLFSRCLWDKMPNCNLFNGRFWNFTI